MSIVVVIFIGLGLFNRGAMSVINAMNNAGQYAEFPRRTSANSKFSPTAELL